MNTISRSSEIITFRCRDNLVYVTPSARYEEALSVARKEFPDVLSGVETNRIRFTLQATMNGTKRAVKISESAWSATISRLLRGEVVDVDVVPIHPQSEKGPDTNHSGLEEKYSYGPVGPPAYRESTTSCPTIQYTQSGGYTRAREDSRGGLSLPRIFKW